MEDKLLVGASPAGPQHLLLGMANRHGLIAGATGTGKTVTLQDLAEGFSAAGVPVFAADVKGDLSGLAMPGSPTAPVHAKLVERAREIGLADYAYAGNPVTFWDLFGADGHRGADHRLRDGAAAAVAADGAERGAGGRAGDPLRYADDEGLLLLNLDDLQSMLTFVADNAAAMSATYGNVTRPSVGAIQRQLLSSSQGGGLFFGEPALDLFDFLRSDENGRGTINILLADKLMTSPRLAPPSCSGCCPSCSSGCPRSAIRPSRSWSSSSTRRTCCSRTRPGRWSTRSSRSCG